MDVVRLGPTPADASRLRAIRLRALRDAPDAFDTTEREAAAWPDEVWTRQVRDIVTFVAVIGGVDVGMVRTVPDTENPRAAWLISMWVDPQTRRSGVGSALIDAVVAYWRRNAAERLLLEVGDQNVAAIALYERKGFMPNGKTGSLSPPRDHLREHQRELVL